MVERVGMDRSVRPAGCLQALFVPSDGGSDEVEDLDDRGTQRGNRVAMATGDVVGYSSTLAVRNVREGDE